MDIQLIYGGSNKIFAIRAVRFATGCKLLEAKRAVESSSGFIVTNDQILMILESYLDHAARISTPRTIVDWTIKAYVPHQPKDFRCYPLNNEDEGRPKPPVEMTGAELEELDDRYPEPLGQNAGTEIPSPWYPR